MSLHETALILDWRERGAGLQACLKSAQKMPSFGP